MPTIDLSTPPPAPTGMLDSLPRRVALTLPELEFVAAAAGGAPLPFQLSSAGARDDTSALAGRLGQSRSSAEEDAYATVLNSLHSPELSLSRRGLLIDGVVDAGLLGATGLLATPEVALDLDVSAGGVRARAWHRLAGQAVASLATIDGIVFELAWFPSAQWPADLARVAVVPEDIALRASDFPEAVDLPFELVDAASEAFRSGRADLVPVLAAQHAGDVFGADGAELAEAEVNAVLASLTGEAQGRLRVMVADVTGDDTTVVGVVSWVLLADGWHALRPHRDDDNHRVEIRRVQVADLASELAPVLAEVTR